MGRKATEPAGSCLLAADQRLGLAVYGQAQGVEPLKLLAVVISFLIDEAMWLGIPGFCASVLCALRPMTVPMSCWEESLFDLFGTIGLGVGVEQFFKRIFQRARPYYRIGTSPANVWGDWWSFPSGHTIRSVYLLFYLGYNQKFGWMSGGGLPPQVLPVVLVLVPLTAWARVAVGRHYPLDTLAGVFVGVAAGYVLEVYLSHSARAVVTTLNGISIGLQWSMLMLMPGVRSVCRGCGVLSMTPLCMLFFYLFYAVVVVRTLAGDWVDANHISFDLAPDGAFVCRTELKIGDYFR